MKEKEKEKERYEKRVFNIDNAFETCQIGRDSWKNRKTPESPFTVILRATSLIGFILTNTFIKLFRFVVSLGAISYSITKPSRI